MLEKGIKLSIDKHVDSPKSARSMGSGDLEVLATPALVAALENAAMLCVAPALAEADTTVGGHIDLKHLRPTAVGQDFKVEAELTEVDGKKLVFSLKASDGKGEIGNGSHVRFIVNRERFMSKL
ncbi:thioesterase family protein [Bacteroides propionicifaciens]|uniref:thioesterase family protein n=1 Tax=Bacteroides propionicifaciens TaxID=392838 RepID=UPI00036053B2|nr:thioesterase family protein [Bacteroides propionicifaciens]